MRSRKQALAVLALAVAAMASAASDGGGSGEFGYWDLAKSAGGPALSLGGTETKTVSAEINEEALSDGDEPEGSVWIEAAACLTNTAGGAVRVRATMLPASGSGPAAERDVPVCPQVTSFALSMWDAFACTNEGPCGGTWDVRFERLGAAGTDLQITWDATSAVTFYGEDDVPPPGADLIVEVEP